jgi:hypothetical protein
MRGDAKDALKRFTERLGAKSIVLQLQRDARFFFGNARLVVAFRIP